METITRDDPSWDPGEVVVWGKPARRLEIVLDEVVSFFDLLRVARDDDAGPLSLAFVKLAMLVIVGVAVTALLGYALGVAVAHGYASFAG